MYQATWTMPHFIGVGGVAVSLLTKFYRRSSDGSVTGVTKREKPRPKPGSLVWMAGFAPPERVRKRVVTKLSQLSASDDSGMPGYVFIAEFSEMLFHFQRKVVRG